MEIAVNISWWDTLGSKYVIGGGEPSSYVACGNGYEFLSQALRGVSSAQILDHGVWEGRHLPILKALAGPQGQVYGVDHPKSWYAVESALRQYPDVSFHPVGDFAPFPFPDEHFDAVLSWRTLHNLTARGQLMFCLGELARILKVGSPLLVSVLAEKGSSTLPQLKIGKNSAGNPRQSWYFSIMAVYATLCCGRGQLQVQKAEQVLEGSVIDGVQVQTPYWAVQLVRLK
ncbi:MAG: class I SAM-dependent methyltransferase [Candidatus Doudnabacteria bacterium]|nr:class I SAM-dependent methyltransferase [Candidatus Doudnabacteria bacterium]